MKKCASPAQVALYEESIVEMLVVLLERPELELRIVALKAVAYRRFTTCYDIRKG